MKSDPAHEHHEKMQLLSKDWERKLKFQAQRAYLDVSDVYWLAHDFLAALLAAEGHRTEEELSHALAVFKHDFLTISPDITNQWQAFFMELSGTQYSGTKPDPEVVHHLFVESQALIQATLLIAIEPVDDFTRHIQAVRVLVQNEEVQKAEEQYQHLMHEYEKLPEEQKRMHYDRFRGIYQAILVARNAQRA